MSTAGAPSRAYVGIGSNLAEPQRQVRGAIDALAALPGTQLAAASRLYRTPPWGDTAQPDFINAVVALDTVLDAPSLLDALRAIEAAAGRARARRWGPRVLDLDLLLHGDARSEIDTLRLPHPHLHERAFVLVPLAEIAPALEIAGHGTVAALCAALDTSGIVPIAEPGLGR